MSLPNSVLLPDIGYISVSDQSKDRKRDREREREREREGEKDREKACI